MDQSDRDLNVHHPIGDQIQSCCGHLQQQLVVDFLPTVLWRRIEHVFLHNYLHKDAAGNFAEGGAAAH